MADSVVTELNDRFGSGGKQLQPDVVAELQSIMRLHELSPEDLWFKWESYSMKMDLEGNNVSITTLRAFKQDLQDALERSNRNPATHIKTEKRVGATPRTVTKNGDVFGILDSLVPGTPATGSKHKLSSNRKRQLDTPSVSRIKSEHPGSSPDNKSSPMRLEDRLNDLGALQPSSFNDRQKAGEVVEVLNDLLPAAEPPIAPFPEPRVKLTAQSEQKKLAYKTLAMRVLEASEVLDDRIENMRKLVEEHHKLDESAFGNAADQSTTEIVAVGRIASDSPEGKLNAPSLVLEMSRRTGNGRRIPLNLDQLRGRYNFFPGQIVAVKGSNTSGKEFTVRETLELPLLPSAASFPADIEGHRERLRGGPDAMDSDTEPLPLNIIFASGPYTADDNLDFEPLHALCSQAADTYADALVLTGPFIDISHPLIASGDFDLPEEATADPDTATLNTVFKYMVSPALNGLVAANPHVTILLVPSVRDAVDKHVSWPQDAFPRRELGLPKSVKIIGNPMTLSINEMNLGISSQDVLFELRTEELVGPRPADGSLLSRLSKYIVEQRHYFPLFPPTDRKKLPKVGAGDGCPPGASLDVGYLELAGMVHSRPDVLVLPSSLPPFAKVVESVLVINPGFLSKRRGAGTYARMTLAAPKVDEAELGEGGLMGHKIYERARVEITRI
ncbi:DNA polymerase subunit alpha B [Coniochaeta sp. 2T2.1]|nr:DNA polymerase subunit alpha B [Coniochaeta sp. 2T2.1]